MDQVTHSDSHELSDFEKAEKFLKQNREFFENKLKALKKMQDKYGVVQKSNGTITLLLGNEEPFYDKSYTP